MKQVQLRYYIHNYQWHHGTTEGYLDLLPEVRAAEVRQFTHFKGYFNALVGKLLLRSALLECGEPLSKLSGIENGVHGKPFHRDLFHFNVTHTDGLVAIAWSNDLPVGLDSERIRKKDPYLFTKQFNEHEMKGFRDSEDPVRAFFKRWTQKEAIVKEIGDGLTLPLRDIKEGPANTFHFRDENWRTQELAVSTDHYLNLATREEVWVDVRKLEF